MTEPSVPPSVASFDEMALSPEVRRAIADAGYTEPTEVQSRTFPFAIQGRDLVVQSRTGSGKTAAFVIPLVDRRIDPEGPVQTMVLCPTRELALQVAGEFQKLGNSRGVRTAAIYGGASMPKQIEELRAGAQVVAGTPGRVLDHLRRGTLDISRLTTFVLDEADEMLSMGFAEELNAILEFIPRTRQGWLFSATIPPTIQRLSGRHLRDPEFVMLSNENVAPADITHYVYYVGMANRLRELARIMELERPERAIVFCNTREETERVAAALQRGGVRAEYINGDLEQRERERVMGAFRKGELHVLVATDVAARGIDVLDVSHVVNFGMPQDAETYVHRTGRTGRAGRRGIAISLLGPQDIGALYLVRLTYGIRPVERSLPSAGEEKARREADRVRMLEEGFAGAPSEEALTLARRVLAHDSGEMIVAGLLSAFFDIAHREAVSTPPPAAAPEPERPARAEPTENRPTRPGRQSRSRGAESAPSETAQKDVRIAAGRAHGIKAGDLVRLLRDRARTRRGDIGVITVSDDASVLAVSEAALPAVLAVLQEARTGDGVAFAPEVLGPSEVPADPSGAPAGSAQ